MGYIIGCAMIKEMERQLLLKEIVLQDQVEAIAGQSWRSCQGFTP
jgi:hypothetical protein